MRRWAIWIGGALAVGAVLFLVLVLTLGRSGKPFNFLAGRKPVVFNPTLHKAMKGMVGDYMYFSYKADYTDVLGAAREELGSLGYEEDVGYGVASFRLGEGIDPLVTVQMAKDRYVDAMGMSSTTRTGWVAVSVVGKPPESMLDRIRSWLRL